MSCCKKIQFKQNVFIKHDCNVSNNWYENINVNFIADEMKVKQIIYQNDGTEDGLLYVNCDISPNCSLGAVYDGSTVNPDISYNLSRRLNGSFGFSIHNIDGSLSALAGELFICLEFIKYS